MKISISELRSLIAEAMAPNGRSLMNQIEVEHEIYAVEQLPSKVRSALQKLFMSDPNAQELLTNLEANGVTLAKATDRASWGGFVYVAMQDDSVLYMFSRPGGPQDPGSWVKCS